MNSLFGVELPTSVTFIIAFVIVLALIGVAAWLVRRFGVARLGAARGRQPRLAVIDAASVDGRRKLIIIRRDNVEHLLMIGGPTDVVVETNILRAAQRDAAAPRVAPPPTDAATWPPQAGEPAPMLQSMPVAPAPRVDRPRLPPEEPVSMPPPAPPLPTTFPAPTITAQLRPAPEPARVQTSIDPLMGLAAELSRSKVEATVRTPEPPRVATPAALAQPAPEPPAVPVPSVAAPAPIAPDVHLAEMAQRLESALRRPLAQKTSGETKRPERTAPIVNSPTNGSNGNGASGKTVYENLEQEMASLLGRQPGKT